MKRNDHTIAQRARRALSGLIAAGALTVSAAPALAAPGGTPGPPQQPRAPQSTSAPSAPASAQAPAAYLTMTVWVDGSDLVAQGALRSTTKPLPGEKVSFLVDGKPVAEGTVDESGNWKTTTALDPIPDGGHVAAASYAGGSEAGAAKVQANITTRKPLKPSDLSGSFVSAKGEAVQAAGPGDEVTLKGALKSGGQGVAGQKVTLALGGTDTTGTTGDDGTYTIKMNVPANAAIGSTLTATIRYEGDATRSAKTTTVPLAVQKVQTPTPTPTPSPTPTPTAAPSPSAASPSAAVTALTVPTSDLPKAPGVMALVPFLVVGLLALAAAGGLGYWLYQHRDDPDPDDA